MKKSLTKNPVKATRMLLSAVLVTGALGSASVLAQTSNQATPQTTPMQPAAAQPQAPAFTGSIQVPRGAALYLDMAKVSLTDAIAAAQQATGTTSSPTSVELEIVNGYLVWNVTLGDQEVLVDAGNGQVLQTMQAEAEEQENEGEEYEGNEQGEHETGARGADEHHGGEHEGDED